MVIAEISVVPLGTKSPSVSRYVAIAIETLKKEKGIRYEITPMGTVVEGSLEDILRAVKRMHEAVFGTGVVRVLTTVKIDDRRDKALSMEDKLNSLTEKLKVLDAGQVEG